MSRVIASTASILSVATLPVMLSYKVPVMEPGDTLVGALRILFKIMPIIFASMVIMVGISLLSRKLKGSTELFLGLILMVITISFYAWVELR